MRRIKILYEHGHDLTSYCSGHIRLIRPLTYPSVAAQYEVDSRRYFDGRKLDIVIVERLLRPGIMMPAAKDLVDTIRHATAKFIYAQDDNIFDLHQGMAGQDWFTDEHLKVMEFFSSEADGIFVSTQKLKQRMIRYNTNIEVVGNYLDERLFSNRINWHNSSYSPRLRIGYMGTLSHDEDIEMIVPALQAVHKKYGQKVIFEMIGGVANEATRKKWGDLPIQNISPPTSEADYPLFMAWFTKQIRWDIAIAPLRHNVYTECKSDIKLLDYGAIGAATVFSRVPPYEHIVHKKLGYIVDNTASAWTMALLELIEDDLLRKAIAKQANEYLMTERILSKSAWRWPDAIQKLLG